MPQLWVRALNFSLFYVELIAATFLFLNKLNKRKLWQLRLIGCIAAAVGVNFFLCWLKDAILSALNTDMFSNLYFGVTFGMTLFVQLCLFALYELTVFVLFRTTVRNVLYIGCAAFALQNVSRCVFSFYRLLISEGPVYPLITFVNPLNLLAYLVIYGGIYTLVYFLFVRWCDSGDEYYLNKKVMGILIAVIMVNVVIGSVDPPRNSAEASALFWFMLLARVLLCAMGLFMQFSMINWIKAQFQQEQMRHMMAKQQEQYEQAKDSMTRVNINAHDLRNQISVIKNAMMQSGKNTEIESELNKMEQEITAVDTLYHTGNRALDVTLTEKSRICANKNIKLSVIAEGACLSFMTDVDIYTLIGNVLDNAIEASESIADPDGRIISFYLHKEKGSVSLHAENTFTVAPAFKNGIPQTVKQDKRMHGYGVQSIIHVAKKYDGNVTMHAENGIFYLNLLLPEKPH